jgi:hypothetical protein
MSLSRETSQEWRVQHLLYGWSVPFASCVASEQEARQHARQLASRGVVKSVWIERRETTPWRRACQSEFPGPVVGAVEGGEPE